MGKWQKARKHHIQESEEAKCEECVCYREDISDIKLISALVIIVFWIYDKVVLENDYSATKKLLKT